MFRGVPPYIELVGKERDEAVIKKNCGGEVAPVPWRDYGWDMETGLPPLPWDAGRASPRGCPCGDGVSAVRRPAILLRIMKSSQRYEARMERSGEEELLPSRGTSPVPLYGRTQEIRQLSDTVAGFVIVSGDAGIGKSALLDHLADGTDPSEIIASPLIRVRHSGGALKYALLESLQHVVEGMIDEQGDTRTIASHLVDAAKRLANDKARELPKVIGRVLLGAIRDRIGSEAADVLAEYIADLQVSYEEDLSARLAAEADRDTVNVLIAFIAEVQVFARRPVVFSLDSGERLSEQELALLADLCEELPPSVGVRFGFSTPDADSRNKVDDLIVAGASEVRLGSLGLNDVREWIESRGLDPKMASEVMRLTDGYPLYVQDVIAALKRGEDTRDIEPSATLGALTRRSWRALDLGAAVVAGKLSAFTDPPPLGRLLDLLGLNFDAWAELERRLSDARIFCTKVNGRAWFHELRRRYIWDSVLTAEERSNGARTAVEELLAEFETERRFDLLGTIPYLASQSQQLASDSNVARALGLDLAGLAIAASLIELTEAEPLVPVLATGAVLNYARSVFNSPGDLLSSLRDLEECGLISYANQSGSFTSLPQWTTPLVPAIIAGRSANELGRVPVSGAATFIFQDALAPKLGAFASAVYGMGRPEVPTLAESVPPLSGGMGDAAGAYRGTHQPSIVIRGSFGGAAAYACATYGEDAARDAVLPEVEGLRADLGSIEFSIVDAVPVPYGAIASRRFLDAAEVVVGRALTGLTQIEMPLALALEESLALKAETIKYVRSVSNQLEQIAYGVDEPIGYVCWKGKAQFVYLTVAGGRERADRLEGEPILPSNGAHMFSELAQRASLMPSESVRGITRISLGNSTRNNPVIEIVSQLQQTAYQFNKIGDRHEVVVSPEELKGEITAALQRRRSDVRHIAQLMNGPSEDLDALAPRKYYLVVIPLKLGDQAFVANSLARYCWEPLEGSETDEIKVYVSPMWEKEVTWDTPNDVLREAFGIDPDEMSWEGLYGDSTIARLLGFEAEHIALRFVDDS